MSLQALYGLFNAQPARWLNLLALFLACAGAWLLLATRRREQAAVGALAVGSDGNAMAAPQDDATQRLNRFFYQFGLSCMAAALLLSWGSSQW